MPNIKPQDTIVQSITNQAQLNYTFAFYAPLATDIQVFYQSNMAIPSPATDLLKLNVDYTITFNPDQTTGGTVTLLFTPTTGYYLTINRQVEASLNTSFSQAQNFNGVNLDAALDRLLLLIQQNLNYAFNRNLGYVINTYIPYTQPNPDTTLPNPYTQLPPLGANQIWQGTGTGVGAFTLEENPDVSTLRSQLAANTIGADGAGIVGYFDVTDGISTTVSAFLNGLPGFIQTSIASDQTTFKSGMMIDYAGVSAPLGWLLCDGSAVDRTTYASLLSAITFSDIGVVTSGSPSVTTLTSTASMFVGMPLTGINIPAGTTIASIDSSSAITLSQNAVGSGSITITFYPWGAGDGSTTFNVPDFRHRVALGSGGTASPYSDFHGTVTGSTGGEDVHTMTIGELVPHNHSIPAVANNIANAGNSALTNSSVGLSTNDTGGGLPFNVMQPGCVVTKIIKT